MPRKSKLTDETQEIIVAALEAGCHDEAAYVAAGISHQTFYRWLAEGDKAKSGRKCEFRDAVTRARGKAESAAVQAIAEQGKKDWRAYAWILERRYSARWANVQRLEVMLEQELEGLLGILESGLEPDEFRKVASVIAAADSKTTA